MARAPAAPARRAGRARRAGARRDRLRAGRVLAERPVEADAGARRCAGDAMRTCARNSARPTCATSSRSAAATRRRVCRRSERLRPRLDALVAQHAIAGYDLAARYLPSARDAARAPGAAARRRDAADRARRRSRAIRRSAPMCSPPSSPTSPSRARAAADPARPRRHAAGDQRRRPAAAARRPCDRAGLAQRPARSGRRRAHRRRARRAAARPEAGVRIAGGRLSRSACCMALAVAALLLVATVWIALRATRARAARAGADGADDAADPRRAARLRRRTQPVPPGRADPGGGPGPGLRAVLRARRRRSRGAAAHAARGDRVQPDHAAGVRVAGRVVDPGAARDRQHGGARRVRELRAGAADRAAAGGTHRARHRHDAACRRRSTATRSWRWCRTRARCACGTQSSRGTRTRIHAAAQATIATRRIRCASRADCAPCTCANTAPRRWPCMAACWRAPRRPREPGLLVALRGVELHVARIDDLPGALDMRRRRAGGRRRSWQYAFRIRTTRRLLAEGRAAVMLQAQGRSAARSRLRAIERVVNLAASPSECEPCPLPSIDRIPPPRARHRRQRRHRRRDLPRSSPPTACTCIVHAQRVTRARRRRSPMRSAPPAAARRRSRSTSPTATHARSAIDALLPAARSRSSSTTPASTTTRRWPA